MVFVIKFGKSPVNGCSHLQVFLIDLWEDCAGKNIIEHTSLQILSVNPITAEIKSICGGKHQPNLPRNLRISCSLSGLDDGRGQLT